MTNTAKQVMDMRPSKGITTAQSDEHQRRWTEKGWSHATATGNYDPSRTHLNFEIVHGKVQPIDKSRSIPERIAANLRERGIRDPNEGLAEPKFRTVVNFIFGGSRERMNELAFGTQQVNFEHGADNSHVTRQADIERWAKDVYDFVSGKYGEENIAAFIVHLDELNPHVHCTLLPIQDGRFAYKKIFAGKDKYEFSERTKQLHSDFAKVNARWGMSRGSSIAETGAKHRSTEEYRRQLSQQCTDIEQQIDRHERTLAELQADIRLANRRVKGLSSMVENLKKEKAEKEAQLAALHRQILGTTDNPEELRRAYDALEKELEDVQEKLADKQEKLTVADEQLQRLKADMDAMQSRTAELADEARRYSQTIHSRVDSVLKDAMLETMVSEHRRQMATLAPEHRQLFDGTFIESVSEQGADVMHCATLLFLGLVNDATTFAAGHGGGGGGSDLKWGRNEDEDDRAWARRCMMMASRMMKPKVGRKPKR